MTEFKDHFSQGSDKYRQYRPSYPPELFHYFASLAPDTQLAWDCATGSGQAAIELVKHFDRVVATDASQSQIDNVNVHERIAYRCAAETDPAIESDSVSLITVAQAFHWFDAAIFFNEVERVLKPEGLLSLLSYNLLSVDADIDEIIHELYFNAIYEYWPPERRLVENGYASIDLPYPEITPADFSMTLEWDLNQLLGYLNTWSAVKRFIADKQCNPVEMVASQLGELWGEADCTKTVSWPLTMRIGRKPG